MTSVPSAPIFEIAPREVVAVEHPMIISNIDNGLKTFGNGQPFERILHVDDPEGCLPLYLRYNDPMCVPILSHNSSTNNVLLKITVPKRTGKKRKRGSQDPYSELDSSQAHEEERNAPIHLPNNLRSHSRNDSPIELLKTLKDNVDKYKIEVVAGIERTHRFRGLADFHHSTSNGEFLPRFRDQVLPGEVRKMRQFNLDPRRGWKQNEEFMPPPALTNHTLPFNWGWHQNPNIATEVNQETGEAFLVNRSKAKTFQVDYLPHDAKSIPQSSPHAVPDDPALCEIIVDLNEALSERPIWTRRALANRVSNSKSYFLIRSALQHVGYQFKGGPFRDAVIKFGVDPRTDPKYRIYQTLFFKLYEEEEKAPFMPWQDVRTGFSLARNVKQTDTTTHLFDGKTLTLDGKIWQICDITDPFLVNVIENASLRSEFDSKSDGYFSNGSWAKIRAIMKTKLIAIRARKTVADSDFETALKIPDIVDDNKKHSRLVHIPVPDIRLTEAEVQELTRRGERSIYRGSGIRRRDYKGKMRNGRIRQKRGERKKDLVKGPRGTVPKASRTSLRDTEILQAEDIEKAKQTEIEIQAGGDFNRMQRTGGDINVRGEQLGSVNEEEMDREGEDYLDGGDLEDVDSEDDEQEDESGSGEEDVPGNSEGEDDFDSD